MFFLENNFFLWFLFFTIFDIIMFCQNENYSNMVEEVIYSEKMILMIFITKGIWIYRVIKYWNYFMSFQGKGSGIEGLLLVLYGMEFVVSVIICICFLAFIYDVFQLYQKHKKGAANCSLKLFLQINNLIGMNANENGIIYNHQKIKFRFIQFLIVCFVINKRNKKNKMKSEKEFQKKIDDRFYTSVIEDLSKLKKENEQKSSEYLEQVKFK